MQQEQKRMNILSYLKGYKKECFLSPLFKLLEACFDLTVPLVMAAIINKGIARHDSEYILRYGGVLILLALVGLTCSITAQYFAAKAAVGFAAKLRHGLFAKIESISFREMDEIGTSTMITRMTSDINQIQSGTNMVLRLLLRSPFIVFGAMVMSFTVDVKAAVVFAIVIPLLAIVVFGIMLITMPLYRKVQEKLDHVLGRVRQNLTGVRVIRAFHKEQDEITRFSDENNALTRMQLMVGRISALTNPVTYVMINVALVLLLWKGAVRIDSGHILQGDMVALVNYMSQILVELIKMANCIVLATKAVACGKRLQSVFDMDSSLKIEGEAEPLQQDGAAAVTFDHVTMSYQGGGDAALENLNFEAKPGQTIGIIGGTGSGKSTLVNLIPRFYDVSEGAVRIDGQDVRSLPLDDLRQSVGIVMQKAVLFQGTIYDNILWGNEDATEEEVIQALKDAQCMDIIEKFPDGVHTMIGSKGIYVSGGESQRLAIARAFLKNAPILILDEATAFADPDNERLVQQAFEKLSKGKTVIMIAHRLSTVTAADQIYVLADGKVAEHGTHEELLAKDAVYGHMWKEYNRSVNWQVGKGGVTA